MVSQVSPFEFLPDITAEGEEALAVAGLTAHAARGHRDFTPLHVTMGPTKVDVPRTDEEIDMLG